MPHDTTSGLSTPDQALKALRETLAFYSSNTSIATEGRQLLHGLTVERLLSNAQTPAAVYGLDVVIPSVTDLVQPQFIAADPSSRSYITVADLLLSRLAFGLRLQGNAPNHRELERAIAQIRLIFGDLPVREIFARAPDSAGWFVSNAHDPAPELALGSTGRRRPRPPIDRSAILSSGALRVAMVDHGGAEDGTSFRQIIATMTEAGAETARLRGVIARPNRYFHEDDLYDTCDQHSSDIGLLAYAFLKTQRRAFRVEVGDGPIFFLQDWQFRDLTPLARKRFLLGAVALIKASFPTLSAVIADVTPIGLAKFLPMVFEPLVGPEAERDLTRRIGELADCDWTTNIYPVLPTLEQSLLQRQVRDLDLQHQTRELDMYSRQVMPDVDPPRSTPRPGSFA